MGNFNSVDILTLLRLAETRISGIETFWRYTSDINSRQQDF